ncbi:MAG: thiamine phosphate synthase [Thermoplasmata archaeon]|nr:thiamine phosphate synthase [Thermoplasmata archaeon]
MSSKNEINWNFYFITDSSLTKQDCLKDVEDAIKGGARVIQYREDRRSATDMMAETRILANLCKKAGVHLLVNNHVDIALAVDADGVHLGQSDMPLEDARQTFPDGIIGISCHTLDDVSEAERKGADYIAVSPVFFTTTKTDISKPLGLDGVSRFRKVTDLPLVAIGGINLDNVRDVVLAGADSVCAISATVATDDVEASVREFEEVIYKAKLERN